MVRKLPKEQFLRLLARLDADPARAADQYERIRRKLIQFFVSRGLQDAAEELTAETIERVAETPEYYHSFTTDPLHGFLRVALAVATRFERNTARTLEPPEAGGGFGGGFGGASLESSTPRILSKISSVSPATARRVKT
jgi:hypothetical protein